MDYFIKKKRGKYRFSPCEHLPEREGSVFTTVRKEEMVLKKELFLLCCSIQFQYSFSAYLTASGLPIKLFLYFLNLRYKRETVRSEAAPHQVS